MFAVEGPGDVAFHQAVYDLYAVDYLAVLDDFQTGSLDNQVILIAGQEFGIAFLAICLSSFLRRWLP